MYLAKGMTKKKTGVSSRFLVIAQASKCSSRNDDMVVK
jgi:hypothetical protein